MELLGKVRLAYTLQVSIVAGQSMPLSGASSEFVVIVQRLAERKLVQLVQGDLLLG